MLPGPLGSGMENTFFAQAYDLDDEWGPNVGSPTAPVGTPPCVKVCCTWSMGKPGSGTYDAKMCANVTKATGGPASCKNACAAASDTDSKMGGIHPRSKKPVGDRLGRAGYNVVYGGKQSYTGPTLGGCVLNGASLNIEFNSSLLRGDKVVLQKYTEASGTQKNCGRHACPPGPASGGGGWTSGSYLDVQVEADDYCLETWPLNATCKSGQPKGTVCPGKYCPKWAGGAGVVAGNNGSTLDLGWIRLNFTAGTPTSIKVDLAPLGGKVHKGIPAVNPLSNLCC